jgi:UDP-N-acetylmuramyl pentapeptide phosphotransferase/UDP-N-acetylglucosamine-1-phosphate transferase
MQQKFKYPLLSAGLLLVALGGLCAVCFELLNQEWTQIAMAVATGSVFVEAIRIFRHAWIPQTKKRKIPANHSQEVA